MVQNISIEMLTEFIRTFNDLHILVVSSQKTYLLYLHSNSDRLRPL